MRNLFINFSYRRFKQSDFKKDNFIVTILSFLVQIFNPINLEIKLDVERDREMVKFLWDECITHDFVRYMYKIQNYVVINKPDLTYQKANNIVKKILKEGVNRINLLKYKIEEKFNLIHYIYSLLFSKICNRASQFEIQNKATFDFYFQTWKSRKQNGSVATKIVNQLSPSQAKQITTEVLSQAKNLKDYQNRDVHENKQAPIDFKIPDAAFQPTMVQIKTIDGSTKNAMDDELINKKAEKRKQIERQLIENKMKINKLKIKKNSINCKFDCCFFLFNKFYSKKIPYIRLPYRFVKNNKQIQFNLPWNYEDSQYIIRLPYISNKASDVENKVLNALKNREDFKKMVISNE